MLFIVHLIQSPDVEESILDWKKFAYSLQKEAGFIFARLQSVYSEEVIRASSYQSGIYQLVSLCCWQDLMSFKRSNSLRSYLHANKVDEIVGQTLISFGTFNAVPFTNHAVLVTACEINFGQTECFIKKFNLAKNYMINCKGFIGFQLLQSVGFYEKFNFINIAEWEKASDFIAAFNAAEFKDIVKGGFEGTSVILPSYKIADLSNAH